MKRDWVITFLGMVLGLLGKSEPLSAADPVELIACEEGACSDENLSFEIEYSVCAALIPGYEVDNTKTGTITAFGSTEPLSHFYIIMPVELASDLGFPTQRAENKYGFAIGTSRAVNGEVLINDQVLGQPGRDYLKGAVQEIPGDDGIGRVNPCGMTFCSAFYCPSPYASSAL